MYQGKRQSPRKQNELQSDKQTPEWESSQSIKKHTEPEEQGLWCKAISAKGLDNPMPRRFGASAWKLQVVAVWVWLYQTTWW